MVMNTHGSDRSADLGPNNVAPQETVDPQAFEALWSRWKEHDLPMVRATLQPVCELSFMNRALLSMLRYNDADSGPMAGVPLCRFLPDCEALQSPNQWMCGFLYQTLQWNGANGVNINIRMLLVKSVDPESGVVAFIGVGVPEEQEQRATRITSTHAFN
jgi:hypothetical protein